MDITESYAEARLLLSLYASCQNCKKSYRNEEVGIDFFGSPLRLSIMHVFMCYYFDTRFRI